ncbi:MAG: hypothetical protein ACRDPH_05350 [Marmoricola sp.]
MTWHSFHRRGDVLRDVADAADRRRDGVLPMDVPGVREHFTDELDLLSALMLRWHTRLSGNVERALMSEPMDLEAAVARAWRRTSDTMPGVRMVIDHATAHPADDEMATAASRAQEREWARLAVAAGLANDQGPAAARAGRRVELEGRTIDTRPLTTRPLTTQPFSLRPASASDPERPSLVERIRAALPA